MLITAADYILALIVLGMIHMKVGVVAWIVNRLLKPKTKRVKKLARYCLSVAGITLFSAICFMQCEIASKSIKIAITIE